MKVFTIVLVLFLSSCAINRNDKQDFEIQKNRSNIVEQKQKLESVIENLDETYRDLETKYRYLETKGRESTKDTATILKLMADTKSNIVLIEEKISKIEAGQEIDTNSVRELIMLENQRVLIISDYLIESEKIDAEVERRMEEIEDYYKPKIQIMRNKIGG